MLIECWKRGDAAISAIEILKVLFPLGVYEVLLFTKNYENLAKASGFLLLLIAAAVSLLYATYVFFIPQINHIEIGKLAPYLYLLIFKAIFDIIILQPQAAVARSKDYVKLNLRALIANLVSAVVAVAGAKYLSPFWGITLYYISLSIVSYLAIIATDFNVLRLSFSLQPIFDEWRTIFMASQIRTMAAINNYGDQFLSGLFMGPQQMALYNLGKRAEIAQTSAMQAFTANIFQPQFARARGRTLKNDYNKALFTVTILMGVAGMAFVANADSIVNTVLGAKWAEATPIVCALMISGFFRSANAVQGAWFSVTKFLPVLRNRTLAYTVTSLVIILLAPWIGLVWVSWLMALKNIVFYVISIRFTRHLANWQRFMTHMIAPLAVSFAAAYAVSIGLRFFHVFDGKLSVVRWVLSAIAAYAIVLAIWPRSSLSVARS